MATQLDDGSTDNRTVAANLIFSFDADGNETDRVFDCGDVGEHQVRLYVTDENENSASAATLVTVEEHLDNLVARAKDITVQLDANGETTISPGDVDDGSSYGCGSTPELSLDIATFDCSHVGTPVTVTLTATQGNQTIKATTQVTVEANGNCGSATFTINAIADVILRENTEYTSVTPVLSGNPKSTVTWTLGGADAGSFSIDGSTGVVTMIAKDFEAPADANADNVYEVSITATDSERNASETSWTVTVEDDPDDETLSQIPSFSIMIPTAFTPNGDGANDVWIIDNLSEDASVRIYDRHGTIIFSSDDGYTRPWDGTSRGSSMPAGSYLYLIQDGLHTYRGSVTILL